MASPYTWLTDVRVQFLPHPGRANAHKSLNDLYSDVLPRLDDLFVDSSRTAVHPDIITILRTKLVNDLIVPHATLTPNPDVVIPPLIQGCFYKLRWTANTHGGTRLRDAQSFATALLDAHSAGKTDVDVLVGINHLHFDPQHKPISYLNWEAISNTPFPSPTTVRPPTASDIASAFTRSLPSVDELGLAIANAFAAVQGNTSTTGAPYSTSASPSLSGLSSSIFNPGNLPTDVLDRYQRHRDNKVFTPALLTHFDGGFFYHEDGVDRLILRDGTFFIMSREDERNFLRESVPCVDDSPIGLRLWYHQVVRHAHSHGYYVHPFWCFWKHPRGGDHGFTCGSLADDDLPQRMSLPTLRHSPTIYTFLTKCVFPPTSNIPSRISLSHGDGYTALRNIIFDVHPVFHPTPAILAKNYPTHREGSTHAYFRAFEDYLQLRAFTQHIDSSLDKPHELDIFISNHRYSTFLGAEYAVARRDPGALLKFQRHQLVQTIDTLLKLPHSPASTPSAQPSSKITNPPPRSSAPSTKFRPSKRLQQVTVEPFITDSHPADTMATIIDSALSSDVPDAAAAHALHHRFVGALYQLEHSPILATEQACIICNDNHRFDACPVLANTDILRSHYIRSCQHLRREAQARAKAFTGQERNLPVPLHTVQLEEAQPDHSDPDFH